MIDDDDVELYEQHASELIRFASVLVGPADADDLVVDTVLKVFASPGWRTVADRRSYLFRALMNQARSAHRSTVRRLVRETRAVNVSTVTVDSVRIEVLDAMRRLTVRQRAVVFFHYWDDLPVDQIAAHLAVSSRTVQRDLDAAQRRLEVLLQ